MGEKSRRAASAVKGTALHPDNFMRVLYCVLFLIFSVIMFVIRGWGEYIFNYYYNNISFFLDAMNYNPPDYLMGITECILGDNPSVCYNKLGVFRISLIMVLFHFGLGIVTIPSAWKWDGRDKLTAFARLANYRLWWIKLPLLFAGFLISIFLPNILFVVWGWISRFMAGGFIFIQIIILIDFAYRLNETLVKMNKMYFYIGIIVLSVILYIIAAIITVASYLMFCWFWDLPGWPDLFCFPYMTVITVNWIIMIIMTVLSLLKKVEHGALLPAAVVSLYTAYIIFSGLLSDTTNCNALNRIEYLQNDEGWASFPVSPTILIGFCITLFSVVYSTFRASGSSDSFSISKDEGDIDFDDEDDNKSEEYNAPRYQFTFFHLVFALAYTYISMLLVSWDLDADPSGRYAVDKGFIAVWIKLVSSWITWIVYFWTLVAPFILFFRNFGDDDSSEGGNDDDDF